MDEVNAESKLKLRNLLKELKDVTNFTDDIRGDDIGLEGTSSRRRRVMDRRPGCCCCWGGEGDLGVV